MAKKKQKIKRTKKTQRGKASGAAKAESIKKKIQKEDEKLKDVLEISQTITDVKSFIERFKADVKKRRKGYQSFAQKIQRKKYR